MWPLLLLTFLPGSAYAQSISRIDVVEYGIYTSNTTREETAPDTAIDARHVVNDIRHAETIRNVPAQKGV
jgi:hypothetical protein